MEPVRFFLPGPTYVREDVRAAMTRQPVGHRSAEFLALYATLGPRLRQVFRTRRDVYLVTSSATLAMESALRSTVGSRVLHLTCGAFSERWHAISRSLGLEADRVEVPWGRALDPELVRQALRRRGYDAVTLAHNETSTGVINPLAEIAAVVRAESDALLLVDAVSSLAGAPVETDEWGLDVVLTAAQKALALPPGLAFIAFSERAERQAESLAHRGFYTDLLRYRDYHAKGSTITTPAVSQVYALDRQLDVILEEGMDQRWARHRRLRGQVERWVDGGDLEFAADREAASPTLSCLQPPAGVEAAGLVAGLAERGLTVAGGYGRWKETSFRIGHMGEIHEADLAALLEALAATLEALRRRA